MWWDVWLETWWASGPGNSQTRAVQKAPFTIWGVRGGFIAESAFKVRIPSNMDYVSSARKEVARDSSGNLSDARHSGRFPAPQWLAHPRQFPGFHSHQGNLVRRTRLQSLPKKEIKWWDERGSGRNSRPPGPRPRTTEVCWLPHSRQNLGASQSWMILTNTSLKGRRNTSFWEHPRDCLQTQTNCRKLSWTEDFCYNH